MRLLSFIKSGLLQQSTKSQGLLIALLFDSPGLDMCCMHNKLKHGSDRKFL